MRNIYKATFVLVGVLLTITAYAESRYELRWESNPQGLMVKSHGMKKFFDMTYRGREGYLKCSIDGKTRVVNHIEKTNKYNYESLHKKNT